MSDKQDEQDQARMAYQLPFPADALEEIVIPRAVPEDERIWVPRRTMSGSARSASTARKATG
jgi:hypothetical protein